MTVESTETNQETTETPSETMTTTATTETVATPEQPAVPTEQPKATTGTVAAPEQPVAPEIPEDIRKELEELRQLKAAKETEAEQKRREKLDEVARITEDKQKAETEAAKLKRELLIAKSQVPEELQPLIPADIEAAQKYLKSENYQKVLKALQATQQINEPTNKETVAADPPPATKAPQEPKKRKFGEITMDDLKAFDSLLLGGE